MTPFRVHISISGPVILGRRLMLDGLLARLILDRTGDMDRAHTEIPLEKRDGIWSGSQCFIVGSAPIRKVQVVQSLRAQFDLTPDMVKPNGNRKTIPRIETARGDYQNEMSTYTRYDARDLCFFGIGDIDAVRDLLSDVNFIGTKRSIGHGEVASITVAEIANESAGIMTEDETPARPIPIDLWKTISRKHAPVGSERIVPPYWKGDMVLCALPVSNTIN